MCDHLDRLSSRHTRVAKEINSNSLRMPQVHQDELHQLTKEYESGFSKLARPLDVVRRLERPNNPMTEEIEAVGAQRFIDLHEL